MSLFEKERKDPFDQEWMALQRKEERFLQKRAEKSDTFLNQKLADKIPPTLQNTLDVAFAKAFELIFEKGTGILEKTYKKEEMQQDFQIREYTVKVKNNRKSLRSFSQKANISKGANLLLSGVSGVGLGILGIGLPDIPLFTAMMLRSIYEIALHYGYTYETEQEKYFILLLIQGALSYGEECRNLDEKANQYISNHLWLEDSLKQEIQKTAGVLSKELLYMKFLQGIPIVGVVGGMYDAVYMKRISEYAGLKYQHRFLQDREES